jgi:hypothetical protein
MSNFQPWRAAPLLVLAFLIQTTWTRGASVGPATLDLAFCVALAMALLGGARVGMWAGAGAGYLAALQAMVHPGSFMVSRFVPCLLVGALAPRFTSSHPIAPPLAAALASMLGDAMWVLLSPSEFPLSFWVSHAAGSMLLHALAIWPTFWLVRRFAVLRERTMWN